jgi:hypothetical protein
MGAKDPARRSKKKHRSARFTIDNELAQLAEVLAEMQLDNTAYGWFRPPWRNGHNAARLCSIAAFLAWDHHEPESTLVHNARRLIDSPTTADTYEQAGDQYRQLAFPKTGNTFRLLATGLRCLQIHLANSHGGGVVYNELLIPAFLPIEPSVVDHVVLEWRCVDSIGTTHMLQGDRNDRQRAAFTTAWRRGLYLTAYALPPAF